MAEEIRGLVKLGNGDSLMFVLPTEATDGQVRDVMDFAAEFFPHVNVAVVVGPHSVIHSPAEASAHDALG